MFPLSLLEKINSLRFTSFFGVAAIFYLVFSTIYQSVSALEHGGWDSTWGRASAVNTDFFSIVQAAPIIMFAFTCQVNVFSIYDELERASPRRMGKVTNQAILTCLLVYLGMGVFGYLQFGDATQGNVLQNCFPTQNPMVIVSFAAITLTIVMAFPLVVFPCRYTVDVMFFHSHAHHASSGSGGGGDAKIPLLQAGESPQQRRIVEFQPDAATGALREVPPTTARGGAASSKEDGLSYGSAASGGQQGPALISGSGAGAGAGAGAGDLQSTCPKFKHFALTTVICAAALVLALKVSKIQIVFQLMGGTTSAFVCFILPAAFAIRLQRQGRLRMSALETCASWGLACGGAAVGLLSTFVTVYNIAVPGVHN
jgi:amino acid permease